MFGIDNNSGLADQVIKAFRKEQIKALKDTYVTLGVDEIVQKNFDVTGKGIEGSRDTESLILGMVCIPTSAYSSTLANRSVFAD